MLEVIFFLLRGIQPFLIPICFITAWTVTILVVMSLWTAARDSVATAKLMHQIPCTGCQFFTDNYRLKCTVRPSIANTEEAIDCRDYQPKTNPYLY
ncbi:hypothetical protein GNF10_20765 [Nostoc sp. UCD121]|uniref:hypothetical protein n=1 Tax=unclassified Nostoc TaxID=2593658 RepID=UPI001624A46E|nr:MULTISPECIES: hypothetical protein [unclassified Nostoc]MBC1224079.1 hypothetical protein [Nostoc sp. UCD120]MBC1278329.1 hypothetical protein [Nostoc sp. UCD121]